MPVTHDPYSVLNTFHSFMGLAANAHPGGKEFFPADFARFVGRAATEGSPEQQRLKELLWYMAAGSICEREFLVDVRDVAGQEEIFNRVIPGLLFRESDEPAKQLLLGIQKTFLEDRDYMVGRRTFKFFHYPNRTSMDFIRSVLATKHYRAARVASLLHVLHDEYLRRSEFGVQLLRAMDSGLALYAIGEHNRDVGLRTFARNEHVTLAVRSAGSGDWVCANDLILAEKIS